MESRKSNDNKRLNKEISSDEEKIKEVKKVKSTDEIRRSVVVASSSKTSNNLCMTPEKSKAIVDNLTKQTQDLTKNYPNQIVGKAIMERDSDKSNESNLDKIKVKITELDKKD